MDFDLDADDLIDGLEELLDDLDGTAARAMQTGMELVAATAKDLAPKDTSELANSIQALPVEGSFSAGTLTGEVFAGAPHAAAQEDGARPHEIRARFRKSLRWPVEGGFRFARAVNHPGNKAQPFLAPALEQHAEDIAEELGAAVDLALAKAGF